jgi:hypothetical protein
MKNIFISIICLLVTDLALAQLSPGDLSEAHKHLEGISNCTECHSIGNKVPDQKCLDCHKEIQTLISANRGFHVSKEVQSKTCIDCHSEHHGRKFEQARFDQDAFDHQLTGYLLEGKHEVIDCRDCHKPDNISITDLRKRDGTFLGLEKACLNCHDDFHQGTFEKDCAQCHDFDVWRPASGFDHDEADFGLKGAHREVDCIKCHKETTRNGKEFQEFTDLEFASCTNCHNDPHDSSFGTNCTDCHGESDWHVLKSGIKLDHNLTDYPLEGMHVSVDCRKCHTSGSYTKSIDHNKCTSCHKDYHRGQLTDDNATVDCQDCHTLESPFSYTLYGLSEHQESIFPLEGAHMATPCFACHLSEDQWEFENIGESCVDCHDDIHDGFISEKYYAGDDCTQCHNSDTWKEVNFDHGTTDYELEGRHNEISCRACHLDFSESGKLINQEFSGLDNACVTCHDNVHGSQFQVEGVTDCTRCHTVTKTWNTDSFDHNGTRFPLEGKHLEIDCKTCHKAKIFEDNVERTDYKIEKFECIDCHS